jgi:hypothetical protein
VVTIAVVAIAFGLLCHGAIRAYRGQEVNSSGLGNLALGKDLLTFDQTPESERVHALLACVPGIHLFVSARSESALVRACARLTSVTAIALVLAFAFSRGDALFYGLVFLQALLFGYMLIGMVFGGEARLLGVARFIPSLDQIAALLTAIPGYVLAVFRSVTSGSEVHFGSHFDRALAERASLVEADTKVYTDARTLPPELIYIPGLNLIFLPAFFRPASYRYAVAVGQ